MVFEPSSLSCCHQHHDHQTIQLKRVRYRLILVRGSDLEWLKRDRLQEVRTGLTAQHKWIPAQRRHRPVCLCSRSHTSPYIRMPAIRLVQGTQWTARVAVWPKPRNHTSARHLFLRWLAGISNSNNSRRLTTYQRDASQRYCKRPTYR